MSVKLQEEKLARLIANNSCGTYHNCKDCKENGYMFCQENHLAKRLVEAGVYIKSDDEVVLNIKEYQEMIQSMIDMTRYDIYQKAKEKAFDMFPWEVVRILDLKKICEIKE